jgi:hypothetical protein
MYYISESINLNEFDQQVRKSKDKFSLFDCVLSEKNLLEKKPKIARPMTSINLKSTMNGNAMGDSRILSNGEINVIVTTPVHFDLT